MKRPLAVMMNKTIRSIPAGSNLREVAKAMTDLRVGALMVEENGQLIGIISETDLVRKGMAQGRNPQEGRAKDFMSSPIISIDIDRPAAEASDLMSEKGIRHLGVSDSGKIVGLISVRDLLRYYKNWGAF